MELLEGLEIEDRYAIVNIMASLVGLKPTKPQTELDLQLKRCRQFKEACMRLETDPSLLIRELIAHAFDTLFHNAWKISVKELVGKGEYDSQYLSCQTLIFEKNRRDLSRSEERDAYLRIESFERYTLFGEQVAGPLMGYC